MKSFINTLLKEILFTAGNNVTPLSTRSSCIFIQKSQTPHWTSFVLVFLTAGSCDSVLPNKKP